MLFAYGKAAWSLHGAAAREWMTLPLAAARRSQSHLANRLLLQAAAMVRYATAVAASLPFPAEALRGATAFLR